LPLIEECLEIALQAPTGGNRQIWRFLVVTDAGKRSAIAELYARAWEQYPAASKSDYPPDDPRHSQIEGVLSSAQYLVEHLHEVPVHVIPCIEGRMEELSYMWTASRLGSVLPAAWSFMLAARARGLGSSWTTLHLMYEKQAAEILGIPATVSQCALLPVGYLQGEDLRPAVRLPVKDVTFLNTWDIPFPSSTS
jgi:nitroreductase